MEGPYKMKKRQSIVDHLKVVSLAYSAVIEIGDSNMILPNSRALAVQRQFEIFYGNEGNFDTYQIFNRPIPVPDITERIMIKRMNEAPTIHVHSVKVLAGAFSSVIQIGSTNIITGEARVKHIRQLGENPRK